MRLPESKIKTAILHPINEVREQALHYFSDVRSPDPTVMPRVIQAVEKHGRDSCFNLLRAAEHLAQTEPTVEWLMVELRWEYGGADVNEDNYRHAVAITLAEADPQLLAPRESQIRALPNFAEPFRATLQSRLEMFSWDWDRCFEALMHFGHCTMFRKHNITQIRYGKRLVEALARYPDHAGNVLEFLKRPYGGKDRSVVLWLEPQMIALAGEMRIEEAIPILVQQTKSKNEQIVEDALTALGRIGSDAVLRAIEKEWRHADQDARCSYAMLLEDIRSDESVQCCRKFLAGEEDTEVQLLLANSLLGNFEEEAIELSWPMVDTIAENDLEPGERDLRYRLVAIATIMGKTFPSFNDWHKAALRDNWGWFNRDLDHFGHGLFALTTGRFAEALQAFNIAIEENPEDIEAYQQRAMTYLRLNRAEEALADAQKAVAMAPDDVESHFLRGKALMHNGLCNLATADFDVVIHDDDDHGSASHRLADAYYQRGLVRAAQEALSAAIRDFSRAIATVPYRAEVYDARAAAYESLGKTREAQRDREEADWRRGKPLN